MDKRKQKKHEDNHNWPIQDIQDIQAKCSGYYSNAGQHLKGFQVTGPSNRVLAPFPPRHTQAASPAFLYTSKLSLPLDRLFVPEKPICPLSRTKHMPWQIKAMATLRFKIIRCMASARGPLWGYRRRNFNRHQASSESQNTPQNDGNYPVLTPYMVGSPVSIDWMR
jgi:hypothetical protein